MKKLNTLLTSFAALAFACGGAQAESYIAQDVAFCQNNPTSVICAEHLSGFQSTQISNNQRDPFINQVETLNRFVVSRFRPQKEDVDVWNVFTNIIDSSRRNSIIGDCEDVAMTTIEYMIKSGIPANRFGRAIVQAFPEANIGDMSTTEIHMVGVYFSVEQNRYYYIGDSYTSSINTKTASIHIPLYVNWLNDGMHWVSWN